MDFKAAFISQGQRRSAQQTSMNTWTPSGQKLNRLPKDVQIHRKLVRIGASVFRATISKFRPPSVLRSITTPVSPTEPPAIRNSCSALPNSIPRICCNPVKTCFTRTRPSFGSPRLTCSKMAMESPVEVGVPLFLLET